MLNSFILKLLSRGFAKRTLVMLKRGIAGSLRDSAVASAKALGDMFIVCFRRSGVVSNKGSGPTIVRFQ